MAIIGGLSATAVFSLIKVELNAALRSGVVSGLPLSTVRGTGDFFFGRPDSPNQVVCFYSPTCDICKSQVANFYRLAKEGADAGFTLRAICPSWSPSAKQIASELDQLCVDHRVGDAIFALESDDGLRARLLEGIIASPTASRHISSDERTAIELGITATSTCVVMNSAGAKYMPSDELAQDLARTVHKGSTSP